MKIDRIVIRNYRSVKSVELNCSSKINAFIGENSSGKSNIFNAINWLLGPVYPTFNSTTPLDHYKGDRENKIKIEISFDDGNYLCLDEEGFNGRPGLVYSGNANRGINDETRTRLYGTASLGIDRQIVDYLPSNRWSLIGRMLLEFNDLFKQETMADPETGEEVRKPDYLKKQLEAIRDNVLFTVQDQGGRRVMTEFIETLKRETSKQLGRPENDLRVDLNLYDPWNFYRTLQLVVKETEHEMEFQASTLGMGVQASLSIAILKAYSQIKLRNNTPIFIDEPELFLHPQAQRNFYKVLQELSDQGTQIFYSTHSPDFLNVGRFNEIYLVRKNSDGTNIKNGSVAKMIVDHKIRTGIETTELEILEKYRTAYQETGDTQKANEAFFSKKIILVEGQSESLVVPYLFDLIEFDHIASSITIVRCGSKGELDRFFRLYAELGIPTYVIFDGDGNHRGTNNEALTAQKNKAILQLFGVNGVDFPDNAVNDRFLGFENTFTDNLGYETRLKGLRLFKEVRSRITRRDDVPAWVAELVEKLKRMDENIASVLLNE